MTEYTLKRIPQYHIYCSILGSYDAKKDYVGAQGDWKAKFIPKRLLISKVDFNPSAYIHDCEFFIGGCKECFDQANINFHYNMINACKMSKALWFPGTDWVRKEVGKLGADSYYFFVDRFGQDAFNFHNNCKHLK